jgi:hypothetical protein
MSSYSSDKVPILQHGLEQCCIAVGACFCLVLAFALAAFDKRGESESERVRGETCDSPT